MMMVMVSIGWPAEGPPEGPEGPAEGPDASRVSSRVVAAVAVVIVLSVVVARCTLLVRVHVQCPCSSVKRPPELDRTQALLLLLRITPAPR